jgi:hypothetical protein
VITTRLVSCEAHHERIWVYDNHIIAMNALIEWEHPLGEPEGYEYPLEIWNDEQEAVYAQLEEELSPIFMPDLFSEDFSIEFGELSDLDDWSGRMTYYHINHLQHFGIEEFEGQVGTSPTQGYLFARADNGKCFLVHENAIFTDYGKAYDAAELKRSQEIERLQTEIIIWKSLTITPPESFEKAYEEMVVPFTPSVATAN